MANALSKLKPLLKRASIVAFFLSGAVFLLGILPFLGVTLLMQVRLIDPTLNPVLLGILFAFSVPAFLILIGIGIFCRLATSR